MTRRQSYIGREGDSDSLRVSIVVTYLDYCMKYLPNWLESIEAQSFPGIDVIIVDQTSDRSIIDVLKKRQVAAVRYQVVVPENRGGFASNYNAGIRAASGEFVFVLNPDTVLEGECVARLVDACRRHESVGCVSPKILRLKDGDINPGSTEIDSAGMILSRSVRHFDRGAGEEDLGQYNEEGMVFGVTGAGAFFRRRCLEDTRLGEQYFDEDFWSYREDADLSWRIQNFGWECIYVPSSVMYHFRSSRPGNRYANSRLVNMHSVKNRYLLMINNLCGRTYLMNLPWIVSRDIVVMLGVLLREPYSIHAYGFLISNCRRLISKRAQLRSRMDCDRSNFWFGHQVVYRASDRIKQGLG